MTPRTVALIDTSALINLASFDGPSLTMDLRISAVTLAELSVGPLTATTDAERAVRQIRLQAVEAYFDPLPFDADAARAFGRVAASLRQRGRKVSARTYDSMIAATAIANGLPLISANPRDFDGIAELEVITL